MLRIALLATLTVLLSAPIPSFAQAAKPIAEFTLTDLDGKDRPLHLHKNKATVLIFLSGECPMCNAYLKPLHDLQAKYKDKGVAFIGVNANAEESSKQVAEHAREYKVAFPMLRDERHEAVKALGAKNTPEVFVLGEGRIVRYRGRIDDGYVARLKPRATISRNDLDVALSELLSGKAVSVPETVAFGCPIQEARPRAAAARTTYYKDVLPVLQNHCQSCHRPGNVGPFSLLTYNQAVRWADLIVAETEARRMPPWRPEPNPLLANERHLPVGARATLAAWVEQGLAKGDAKDAPPPPKFPEGWSLGTPDLVLEMPSEAVVAASGPDTFQVVIFPTDFGEDRYISAIEVQPGNARVVHHTIQLYDTSGAAQRVLDYHRKRAKPDDPDRGPGYFVNFGLGFFPNPSAGLGGWAPGLVPTRLPDGVGMKLPKGADLILHIHYHRTGKEERDKTRLGIFFAKSEVKSHFMALPVPGLFVNIPAGKKEFKVDTSVRLTDDLTAYWAMPHMHLLGKDIELTARFPEGKEQTLIRINDWDYNWQEMYQFKEPLKLPKGTELRVKATFDNSADNPLNPSRPPRSVFVGEGTTNEMCFVFLGTASERPGWMKFTLKLGK